MLFGSLRLCIYFMNSSFWLEILISGSKVKRYLTAKQLSNLTVVVEVRSENSYLLGANVTSKTYAIWFKDVIKCALRTLVRYVWLWSCVGYGVGGKAVTRHRQRRSLAWTPFIQTRTFCDNGQPPAVFLCQGQQSIVCPMATLKLVKVCQDYTRFELGFKLSFQEPLWKWDIWVMRLNSQWFINRNGLVLCKKKTYTYILTEYFYWLSRVKFFRWYE